MIDGGDVWRMSFETVSLLSSVVILTFCWKLAIDWKGCWATSESDWPPPNVWPQTQLHRSDWCCAKFQRIFLCPEDRGLSLWMETHVDSSQQEQNFLLTIVFSPTELPSLPSYCTTDCCILPSYHWQCYFAKLPLTRLFFPFSSLGFI